MITKIINKILKKLQIDITKHEFDKDDIGDIARSMNVALSPFQLTEAMFFSC